MRNAASAADAKAQSDAGCILSRSERHEEALACFERAVALDPDCVDHHFNMAMELRFLGRLAESEACCDTVIALDPNQYEAWLIRSGLREQTAENNHVTDLLGRLVLGVSDRLGDSLLQYALAKEYEDLRDYDRAFEAMRKGARLRRGTFHYDVARDEAIIDAIIQGFRSDIFADAPAGCASSRPIFVVGLPRSGSTLLERLMARHPAVQAAGELQSFTRAMMQALRASGFSGGPASAMVGACLRLDFRQLGEAYLSHAAPFAGDAPHFIDKLPFNYLYCGLIRLALPNARIIRIRREPTDACLAMYKTSFGDAYPFSYDFDELARYHAAYARLMAHWHEVLPETVIDVDYDSLVTDPETEMRRMLAHCGLDWTPVCAGTDGTVGAVTTASAAQVRRPIYATSVGNWRHYERHLEPLRHRLAELGQISPIHL